VDSRSAINQSTVRCEARILAPRAKAEQVSFQVQSHQFVCSTLCCSHCGPLDTCSSGKATFAISVGSSTSPSWTVGAWVSEWSEGMLVDAWNGRREWSTYRCRRAYKTFVSPFEHRPETVELYTAMRRTIPLWAASLTYHNVHLVKCRTAVAAGSSGSVGLRPAAALPS